MFVIRLKGFADPALATYDGVEVGIAQLGAGMRALREARCQIVCFAGLVARPDFRDLKPDLRGMAALPAAIAAARRGDDGLLAFLVGVFEREGFSVEGAHEVMADLTLAAGPLGSHAPSDRDLGDIARAMESARAIGALDIGQAAVCCAGLVLALEAQEGTDAMLARVADLPEAIRGAQPLPRGVLAKVCKPGQEARIDLPTIGPETVRGAARAGLAGIVGEAGRVLVLEKAEVASLADALGLFVFGASVWPP